MRSIQRTIGRVAPMRRRTCAELSRFKLTQPARYGNRPADVSERAPRCVCCARPKPFDKYRSGSATRASPTASESREVCSFAAALTQCSDRTAIHAPRGARGSARCTIRRVTDSITTPAPYVQRTMTAFDLYLYARRPSS